MSRRKRNNRTQFSLFAFQDIITCVMGIMLLVTLMMCLQITEVVAVSSDSDVADAVRQMKVRAAALSAEIDELQQTVDEQATLLNSGAINDETLLRNRSATLEADNRIAQERMKRLLEEQAATQQKLSDLNNIAIREASQPEQTEELKAENQRLQEQLEQLKNGERVIYNAHTSNAQTCWLVEMTAPGKFMVAELGKQQSPKSFQSQQDLSAWMQQRHRGGASFMLVVKPDAADTFDQLAEQMRRQKIAFGFDLMPQDRTAIDSAAGAVAQ